MLSFKYFLFGFLLFIGFFVVNPLYANDVAYSFNLSKTDPYEREGVFLEVNLTQVDQSKVMMFKFSLKDSENYEFHQVGFKEHENYHDLRHEYLYLIYPKKSGEVDLAFEMRKSITDDDKVAYSISGDRDNVKGLEKKDFDVALKPLRLEVKPLPEGTDLVGEFTFEHHLDRKETEAFDPINLKVELKGEGLLSSFELLKPSDAYKLFTQDPTFKIYHTKLGSNSSLAWAYAISAKKDFTLPKIVLNAFNPKTQKRYALTLPSYSIEVETIDETSLLDSENYPEKSKGIDSDFWTWLLSYLVVFMAGLLTPRDIFQKKKTIETSAKERLHLKISRARTHKALLHLLLLENDGRYAEAIEVLEGVVYNGEQKSLVSIKKELESIS